MWDCVTRAWTSGHNSQVKGVSCDVRLEMLWMTVWREAFGFFLSFRPIVM